MTRWNDQQIGAFLAVTETDHMAPFWFLTLLEAMQRGKALGLHWHDLHWSVDELDAIAKISQTIVPDLAHGGWALIQDRARMEASQRAVRLTAPTVALLKRHRDRQRFERQALPDLFGDHELVVTTSFGHRSPPAASSDPCAA